MTQVRSSCSTRERILAVALPLFAKLGPEGLGIRQLAAAAQVNIAAVNYHFGSKQALFREVCLVRFRTINQERTRLLEPLEETKSRPSLEAILRAFLSPVVEVDNKNPAHLLFLRVVMAQVVRRNRALEAVIVGEEQPLVVRVLNLLERALPKAGRERLSLGLSQTVGAMNHLLVHGVLAQRITGRKPLPPAAVLDALIQHAAGGLRALAR